MLTWVREILVCPRDKSSLRPAADSLVCERGHRYSVVDGIPILLVADAVQTHWVASLALAAAAGPREPEEVSSGAVDPFVQQAIGATNGFLYRSLIGRLTDYPIPELGRAETRGQRLLEVGCNWGLSRRPAPGTRWSDWTHRSTP